MGQPYLYNINIDLKFFNNMNIRLMQETIYHEFGHVIVYILSNKYQETFLGEIDRVLIGYRNLVSPKENLYYYELSSTNNHITENSKNIKRSISWIILQMSGCIFESYYENKDFSNYFCSHVDCSGRKDFENLYHFQNKSSFKIGDDDINRIRDNYISFLNKNDIFNKTKIYLEHFVDVFNGSTHINFLDEDDIGTLLDEMETFIIDEDLIRDYHFLIIEEAEKFYSSK